MAFITFNFNVIVKFPFRFINYYILNMEYYFSKKLKHFLLKIVHKKGEQKEGK